MNKKLIDTIIDDFNIVITIIINTKMNDQIEFELQRLLTVKNRAMNNTTLDSNMKTLLVGNLEEIQQTLNKVKERDKYCRMHNIIPDYNSFFEAAKTKLTVLNLSLLKL